MPTGPAAPGSAPIRNLQEMLRTLSHIHREIPLLSPNGIFGEATLEAVMVFQRLMALPVNGQVDQATWDALVEEEARVTRQLAPPRPVHLFPHRTLAVRPGESSPLLFPIQGMFLALAGVFASVQASPASGRLDSGTQANLRWLQGFGGQPETGVLDRETWDLLSHVFETFVSRQPQ